MKKRLLLLCFATLLGLVGIHAGSYKLIVGGVQVTDDNCNNIMTGVKYNPSMNKLTLNNANISSSEPAGNSGAGIYSGIDGLTIEVRGTNTVKSANYSALCLYANTKITTYDGNGKLNLYGSTSYYCISSYSDCNFAFENKVEIIGKTYGAFMRTVKDISFNNCIIRAEGTGRFIYDIAGTVTWGSGVNMRCIDYYNNTSVATVNFNNADHKALTYKNNNDENVVITGKVTIAPTYGFAVAGKPVWEDNYSDVFGDGKVVYNRTSNYAMLKNVNFDLVKIPAVHNYGNEGLEVRFNGTNKITVDDYNVFVLSKKSYFYDSGVNKLDINVKTNHRIFYCNTNAIQLFSGLSFTGTAARAFYGPNADVQLEGGTINFKSKSWTPVEVKSFSLYNGLKIIKPKNATISNGKIQVNGADYIGDLLISKGYGISVGGEEVIESNYNDILGDGKVWYSPVNNTLTLDNASINGIKNYDNDNLTIKLKGTSESGEIELYKPTTIQSASGTSGMLKINKGGFTGIHGYTSGTLTIKDCRVNIGTPTYGIHGNGSLNIVVDNAELISLGSTASIFNIKSLTLNGGTGYIVPSSAPSLKDGSLVDGSGNKLKSVHISTPLGLSLSGILVTTYNAGDILGDGKANYSVSKKTLTLSTGTYAGLKNTAIEDFTLAYSGTVKMTAQVQFSKTSTIRAEGYSDLLDINAPTGAAIYFNGSGDLTISRGSVKAVSQKASGVVGYNGSNNLYIGSNGALLARSINPSAETSASLTNFKSITYGPGLELYPDYVKIANSGSDTYVSVVNPNGSRCRDNVIIGAAYGAKVAGYCPVVGLTLDDVLLDGGSVSYNTGSNSLVLKNANIVNKYDGNAISMKGSNAKIVLEGNNTIDNQADGHGIYATEALTISGNSDAALKITSKGSNTSDKPVAMESGNIEISNVKLDINHPRYVIGGLSDTDLLNVKLSNVNLKATTDYESQGAITKASDITISGVTFEGTLPFIYANSAKPVNLTVSGDNNIKFENRGISIDSPSSALNIKGYNKMSSKLTMTSAGGSSGIYTRSAVSLKDVNLNIDSKSYGIFGQSGGSNVPLTVENSHVELNGGTAAMLHMGPMNLVGNMNVIEPLGATYHEGKGTIVSGDETQKHIVLDNYDPIDYSLKVGGIDVTSLNASDVLGNGKVKYDAASNTLSLDNASITNTTASAAIEYNGSESNFTIKLKGSNTVNNTAVVNNGITANNYIAIKGDSKADNLIIKSNTINEFGQAIATWDGGTILVDNCMLETHDPHSGIGAIGSKLATVTFKNAIYNSNITADEPYKYQYAAIHNVETLNIDNAEIIVQQGKNHTSAVYANDDLTINILGGDENIIASTVGSDANAIVLGDDSEKTLTIVSSSVDNKVNIRGAHNGIYVPGKNKTININAVNANVAGQGYAAIGGSENDYALTLKDAKATLSGSKMAVVNAKPLKLDNVDLTGPGNATYNEAAGKYVIGSDDVPVVQFDIHKAKDYGVSIVNTATSDVVNLNSDNLSFTDGTGIMSLDPATGILTVSNVNLPDYALIIQPTAYLTASIKVDGDNVLRSIATSSAIIGGNGGSLTLKDTDPANVAFLAKENITINGITLNVEGEYGMMAMKDISFLNVNASLKGKFFAYGNMSFSGCSIVQPQGYTMDGGMMKIDGNPYTGEVVISTATAYDIKVKGANVTSINAGDILGDGTMYYDETSKKLVLNNVNANWAGANNMLIDSDIDGLTVEVNGDNTIKGAGIKFGKNTVMLGTGSLNIIQGIHEGGAAIESGDVVIVKNITLKAQGSNVGLRGPGAFVFANVIASITGGLSNVVNVGDIQLSGCGFELPADGVYNISDMRMDDFNGNAYSGEIRIRPFTNYNLYIMGSRVNDINCGDILHDGGKVVYDDATKTLTLTDFQETVEHTFLESFEELNVVVNGNNELRASKLIFNANATITGAGKLTVTSDDDAIVMDGGELIIKDADLLVDGVNGIVGKNGAVVKVDNSNVEINATGKAVTGFLSDNLVGCATTRNTYYDLTETVFKNMNGEAMSSLVIAPATIYESYIWNAQADYGYEINSLNANDVMEDGTLSYDPVLGVCVFNNCNHPEMQVSIIENMNVVVNGTNNVNSAFFPNIVNVSGDGTLNINDEKGYNGFAFGNDITIEDVTLNVKSISKAIVSSNGTGILTIKGNAHVTAQGNSGSICEFGGLNLDGVVIVEPENAFYDLILGGVAVAGSITCDEVKIIPESEAGVHEITLDDADAKKFDVTGRQVTDSYRGIVISNGKKVVKK